METTTLNISNTYPTHLKEINRPLAGFVRRPQDSLVCLISAAALSQNDHSQKEAVNSINQLAKESSDKTTQTQEKCKEIHQHLLERLRELPAEEQERITLPTIEEHETTDQSNYVYTSFLSKDYYSDQRSTKCTNPLAVIKEVVLHTTNSATPAGFIPNLFNGTGKLAIQEKTYDGEFNRGIPQGFGFRISHQKIYQGQFLNGKRHGYGTETDNLSTYKGQWEKGKPNGLGEKKTDTISYFGNFKDGLYDGYGMLTQNQIVYDGIWKEGALLKGTMIYPNKDLYEGELKELLPHGQGKMSFSSGEIYNGLWVNGKRYGKGTFTYLENSKKEEYVGQWKNDQIFGKGTMQYKNGHMYDGDWKNGLRFGHGRLVTPEGTCIGKWENNIGVQITYSKMNGFQFEGQLAKGDLLKSGKITLHSRNIHEFEGKWADGKGKLETEHATYEGEFKDNKLTGIVTITYKDPPKLNGSLRVKKTCPIKYVGEVDNWVPHGTGTMTYDNYRYKITTSYHLSVNEYSGAWEKNSWTMGKVTLVDPIQNEKEPPILAIEKDWQKPFENEQLSIYYKPGKGIHKYTGFVSPPFQTDPLPETNGFLCIPTETSTSVTPTAFKRLAEVGTSIMYYSNGSSLEKYLGEPLKITTADGAIITGLFIRPNSGEIEYPNGDIYKGKVVKINERDYRPEGQGTMTYAARADSPSEAVARNWHRSDNRENFRGTGISPTIVKTSKERSNALNSKVLA